MKRADNFKLLDELKKEIRWRRKRQGLTQGGLALRASVSVESARNVELGRGCNVTTLCAVCDALGIQLCIKGLEAK